MKKTPPHTKQKEIIVPMAYGLVLPRAPQYIKTTEGNWLPLCALAEEGIRQLADSWCAELLERRKEQAKNPRFYFDQAGNIHARARIEAGEQPPPEATPQPKASGKKEKSPALASPAKEKISQ